MVVAANATHIEPAPGGSQSSLKHLYNLDQLLKILKSTKLQISFLYIAFICEWCQKQADINCHFLNNNWKNILIIITVFYKLTLSYTTLFYVMLYQAKNSSPFTIFYHSLCNLDNNITFSCYENRIINDIMCEKVDEETNECFWYIFMLWSSER